MHPRLVFAGLVGALVLSSCVIRIGDGDWGGWGHRLQGDGVAASEVRAVGPFDAIGLEDSIDLVVRVGSEQHVVVHGDQNLLEYVRTEVDDGKLEIEMRRGSYSQRENLWVEVSVPTLESVALYGSADAVIHGLSGDEVELWISGSGDIEANGDVGFLDVRINGSGDMKLFELAAREASVRISGSGDVFAHVTDSLDVRITGSGDVVYRGKPACSLAVSGSGSVRGSPGPARN